MSRQRSSPIHALLLVCCGLGGMLSGPARASDDDHGSGVEVEAGAEAAAEAGEHADSVALTPEQRESLGINVTEAAAGRIDSGIELLGEVRANGDRLAHIVPRFPGIVREVRRTAGDAVASGDVLAIIESSDSLAPYELRTLIDGVVLTRHLTRGEAVDRAKDAFVVADLSTVWVELSVYQKDLARVRVGQEVRVQSVDGSLDATGRVGYVTPVIDQATRTAVARVVLPNPERLWMPGMFVTGRTVDARSAAVVVPKTAIQTVEGEPAVFVATEDGFSARPVLRGREGETTVEILRGLAPGERIATTNTFLLKSELAKGEAEHEH